MQLIGFLVVCCSLLVAVVLATVGDEVAAVLRQFVDVFQRSDFERDLIKLHQNFH